MALYLDSDGNIVEVVRFNGHVFDEDPDWLDDAFMVGNIWRSADGKYRLNDSSTDILTELKEGDYVVRQLCGRVSKITGSAINVMIGDKL